VYIRENEGDKEDLAGCNVLLAVALWLCAAVAAAFYTPSTTPFKDLVNGLGWGVRVFCRSKNFVSKYAWCNNANVFCAFQIYNIKTTPLAPCSDVRNLGWEVELIKAGPNATNAMSYCSSFAKSSLSSPFYL